jgi:hypothetical protein
MTSRPARATPPDTRFDLEPAIWHTASSLAADIGWAMRTFDDGALNHMAPAGTAWKAIGRQTAAAASPVSVETVLVACRGAGASALPLARMTGPTGHVDATTLISCAQRLARSPATVETSRG